MRHYLKIQMRPPWFSFNCQFQINTKTDYFLIPQFQPTSVLQRNIEGALIVFEHRQSWRVTDALSLNFLAGVVFFRDVGENFVEIARVELEHAVAPGVLVEVGVENAPVEGVGEDVFVEIEGDELLNAAVDAEWRGEYFGSKGISSTFLVPQVHEVELAVWMSKVEIRPIF